jgi:AcrR family transcriptional regulator
VDMSTVQEVPRRRGPYAKSAQRSSDIIDVATKVFATHGYHGGSLRDIARQLDVSLTSVVHHFGSKYELLEAVLEHADHTGSSDFEADCKDFGVMTATMRRVRSNADRPGLLRLLATLSAEASTVGHPAHEWFVDRYRRKKNDLAAAFAFDQRSGRLDARHDPHMLSALLTGVWDGLQLQWLIDSTLDMEGSMRAFFNGTTPEAHEAFPAPPL